MVARPSSPFRSGNAGELSPDAAGRIDIKQYYSAALRMKNVEPVPQSGWRQMGGSRFVSQWRRALGGAQVVDDAAHGLALVLNTPLVVGGGMASNDIAMVEVKDFLIVAGTATFWVQTLRDGNWTSIGGEFRVVANQPVTRFAAKQPGGGLQAAGVRIMATFDTATTWSIGSVTAFSETGSATAPRMTSLTLDDDDEIICCVSPGVADFFRGGSHVGAVRHAIPVQHLSGIDFYCEGRTIGVFHNQIRTARFFLGEGSLSDWRVDDWPFESLPLIDLGDEYVKSDDIWEVYLREANPTYIYLSVTVDGETTPAIPLTDAANVVVMTDNVAADWALLATNLQAALQDLPSLGPGVTVTQSASPGLLRKLVVTFGGDQSGAEYQFSAIIANTADASALAFHTAIGETELEPLFSAARGWPGTAELVQDRMAYGRIKATPGAVAMSRIGEYFDLDITGPTDQAARLDKLRSQTNETILALKAADYLLTFTDRGAYFCPNRTIERNTPLNFVRFSEVGIQANCKPFELEGEVHYVGKGGNQIFRAVYDDVSTKFSSIPISLLATHLTQGILRSATQAAESDIDAQRAWQLRSDGRLIAGQFIASQEIAGFCEWIAAGNGLVREIVVDGRNQLWMAVQRGGATSIERYDTSIFLQDASNANTDLAGLISGGLSRLEGAQVWAMADGYVLGPYTVTNGKIDLQQSYLDVIVGRWQPPIFETMPLVHVNGNDEVVLRPGRIHTAQINVIDTTSIAVAANGQPVRNISLTTTDDRTDQPLPPKTRLVEVNGEDLLGNATGTTLVITQTRPGTLRVRDFAIGAKL